MTNSTGAQSSKRSPPARPASTSGTALSFGALQQITRNRSLARRHDARLTMLHAIENIPEHMVLSGSEAWRVMQRLPAQARQLAGRLRQRAALLSVVLATALAGGGLVIAEGTPEEVADCVVRLIDDDSRAGAILQGLSQGRVKGKARQAQQPPHQTGDRQHVQRVIDMEAAACGVKGQQRPGMDPFVLADVVDPVRQRKA